MVDAGDQPSGVGPGTVGVGLLGPLSIIVDGVDRSVTAPRQRAVLAFLAVHTGEGVSADRLLDAVWGDDLPAAATKAVAFQISKLRSVLEPDRVGEGSLITTSSSGYVLNAILEDVDVHRFERLVTDARDVLVADPVDCEMLIDAALGLWRGRPFADLNDEPFVDDEIRRLEQLHLLARRTLAEARIARGRHLDVVGDLQTMVIEQPLDEAVVALSMVALQRSGRTADALRAFGDLRMRLSSELGIEPSNDLRQLERELLDGTPAATAGPVAGAKPTAADGRAPVPAEPTSFVGRVDDISGICAMLRSTRVMTLCGFGGLGKTRLAQEIANTVADRFEDGVWYVDLTSINDPNLLVDTFLAAGDADGIGHDDPIDRLLRLLAGREVLVVVDQCEHLVEEVASLVADMVRAAPQVRVLATSRVTLGISGEAIWAVHPLGAESGVDLLIDRARLARAGFVDDETDREAVERLADHLEGIPLAIELAAARLSVMSVDQVHALLDDRFGLLAATGRGVDEKRRSLAAVIGWSYELLDESERSLLRRFSVCVGGFTLDAALQLGAPEGDDSSVADVLDRLGHLVEASLVQFDDSDGRPRYHMLETVREYAAGQLDALEPGERVAVGLAHAHHYESVATEVCALQLEDHRRWLSLGDQEIGNLHAAMDWAYHHGEPRLGLSIALSLRPYQQSRGVQGGYLRTAVELIDDDSPEVLEAAALALITDHEHVVDLEFQAVAVARIERGLDATDDPALRSILLRGLAEHHGMSDPCACDDLLIAVAEIEGASPASTLSAIANRVFNSWDTGRVVNEAAMLRQIDEIVDANPSLSVAAVGLRAVIEASGGRWDDVLRIAAGAAGLDGVDEYPITYSSAEALIGLGRYPEAAASLARSEMIGTKREVMMCTPITRASLNLALGDPAGAVAALGPAVDFVRRDPRRLGIAARVASMLAVANDVGGFPETAAVLFGHSIAEQERLGITLRAFERPAAERAIEACRAVLGDERFDELAASGAAMQFVDLPLDVANLAELR